MAGLYIYILKKCIVIAFKYIKIFIQVLYAPKYFARTVD